jgi:outer membrane protein
MKLFVRSTVAVLALMLASGGALAAQQGPTVVFLDSERIGQQATALQQARQRLQQEITDLETRAEAELAPLQEELQRLAQTFQQQQATMSPERRQQQQQQLIQRQQELQQRGASFDQQAQAKQAEILGPAYERVNAVINQVRRDRGYTFILDIAAGGVIAADPNLDITNEVVRLLNAQGTTGS